MQTGSQTGGLNPKSPIRQEGPPANKNTGAIHSLENTGAVIVVSAMCGAAGHARGASHGAERGGSLHLR